MQPKNCVFSLVFMVFFANALHGRKFNDTEMPKSKTKADTAPKIAQDGSTWAQYGANVAQNVPT